MLLLEAYFLMAKKKVNPWVEETLWEEFKRFAFKKRENFHGV